MKNQPSRDQTSVSVQDTSYSIVHYRDFDPISIGQEIVSSAMEVKEALRQYESAKVVPQHVLDTEICV